MPDYSKGKIYTIRCRNDNSLIYVGSTIQSLAKRWGSHKVVSLRLPNILLYEKINNEWDNWYIELYELYPCNTKEELCKKEGEVIREIGTLNKRIECRTKKEWYNENKDEILEKKKQYQKENFDKIKEYNKQYKNENKDEILEKRKQYRNENKDKILEKQKQYYNENKDKILEKGSQIIVCECGCELTKSHLSRHKKSQKHQEFINLSSKQD